MLNLFQHPWSALSVRYRAAFKGRPWTLKQVGNYTLGIRKPPYFVIASGAKQSRVYANRSGLLRSARNDGMTDAKEISAKQDQGDVGECHERRFTPHWSETCFATSGQIGIPPGRARGGRHGE